MLSTITRYRGDTVPRRYALTSGGVAVNITGYSFKLTVNTEESPADATNQVAQITGVIDSAQDGEFHFPFDGSIAAGSYWYDIEVTDSGGEKQTYRKGRFVLTQDITK